MDGGTRIAEVIKAAGVEHIFTLCGGHISPILAGCKKLGVDVVDVRDEKNAVFAADAYARLSGLVGVAAVTAGPGVTNTITAIKNAQMAHSPLVVLGGATATVLKGRGSLQDIDQMALVRPHVKWAARTERVRDLVPTLRRAFTLAASGTPGPVFVEIPVDLLYEEEVVRSWYLKKSAAPPSLATRLLNWYLKRHLNKIFVPVKGQDNPAPAAAEIKNATSSELRAASRRIAKAERPVLVIGSQALLDPDSLDELVQGIEKLQIPVFLSGMARGLLGADHPLQMRHKRRLALKEADLVILCGVPCDFRLDYGNHIRRSTTLVSINRDLQALKLNRTPCLGIHGDPQQFLIQLSTSHTQSSESWESWRQQLRARHDARNEEIEHQSTESVERINPLSLCKAMDSRLSADSVLVADGGDFVATASYVVQPRTPLSWLDPGVFGTLGVGAGFALAAKLCRPNADVWVIYGDGSVGFSAMEFDTFVRHKTPVIAIVGNDACWSQIAREQVEILGDDVGTNLRYTDYHTVAEGCGGKGLLLERPEDVPAVLDEAIRLSREGHPVLINAHISPTDFRKGSISM
ncbi:MAG: acetolactate synthase [Myxococcales bacterium]|nr:acetolactate synthase [Myxococcales bacterium]